MIDVVTDVVTSTFALIEFFLLTGSQTGELIVYTCLRAASLISGFFDVLTTVAVIVVEDNKSFFVQDVPGIIDDIAGALVYNPLIALENLVNLVLSLFTSAWNFFYTSFYFINSVIYNIIRTAKSIITLVGAAVWFLVTLIPYNLTSFIKFIFSFIYDVILNIVQHLCNMVIEAYGFLLEVANFMTDVPLQSFLGIIIGTLIIRIVNQYKADICDFCREAYIYLVTTPPEEINIDALETEEVETRTGVWQETSCVVCRDSEKCVVTFPCKHICMCRQCFRHVFVSDQLQRRCPICRTFINDFLLVYI